MKQFATIVEGHQARYPLMRPQDYGKLAFQNEFGPEHLVTDEEGMLRRLREEWDAVGETASTREPEDIGNGLCRVCLNHDAEKDVESQILVKLFLLTANTHVGTREGLEKKLSYLETLSVPGIKEWVSEYRAQGCPAVSHSADYRAAYAPHYRLVRTDYARAYPILVRIAKLDKPAVVAIDGRCGSGKTSLAALIAQVFDCNVFHMDDFYLPKEQRPENWLELPGGNMDLRRFRREVLEPTFAGKEVLYRPFDCGRGEFAPAVPVPHKELTIIEGSYSHHPELGAPYGLKLFVTCEKEEQLRRLKEREGDYFPTFRRLWMPLEEQYIRHCEIEENGAVLVDTTAAQ